MKSINIIYWTVTILFALFMLSSAIPEVMQTAQSKTFMGHLGYPDYFNPFLGVLKILGILAILIPGYPRIKEWAYAGLTFDLVGATYSQIATDGFLPQISFMLLPIIFCFVSYIYYHKRLNHSRRTANA